ncbi:GDCCVxC domain-containing (seleno)protein [Dyella sp. 2HG41-7]|uniref:GDCCVxC domain-containing (seleno)protein n=1 Tax=Dyella sp. 2HG41-7 TaxID=2883239 RepID=UPI001F3EA31C|nr:GDCCVxC domain-containing (seleno)protein [Dyella sp. 2HG41-7]
MSDVILQSVITCPHCGFSREETMPVDACLFFYDCTHCNALLRPKSGDCCVFCSYGSVKCPPIQQHSSDATHQDGESASPCCGRHH